MQLKSARISILLLTTLFLVNMLGCSGNSATKPGASQPDPGQKNQFTIASSFYPMYIMALNVAKDVPGVNVVNMAPPQSGCLHDYQLTPNDLKTLENARILIVNGAGMETFIQKAIDQHPSLKIVNASKGVNLIKNNSDGQDNPHVWVSVSGAMQQVKNIGEQLAVLDPANAEKYRANTAAYIDKLTALKNKMHASLDGITNRNIVTFHEAFPYFAREFKLQVAAVVEREPGSEPSAGELADTMALVKQAGVKALFAEPQYPAKAANTIANETGAKVFYLDPGVAGPMEPDAYINIMNQNLKVLEEALKQ